MTGKDEKRLDGSPHIRKTVSTEAKVTIGAGQGPSRGLEAKIKGFEEHRNILDFCIRPWAVRPPDREDEGSDQCSPSPFLPPHIYLGFLHWEDPSCNPLGCPHPPSGRESIIKIFLDFRFTQRASHPRQPGPPPSSQQERRSRRRARPRTRSRGSGKQSDGFQTLEIPGLHTRLSRSSCMIRVESL